MNSNIVELRMLMLHLYSSQQYHSETVCNENSSASGSIKTSTRVFSNTKLNVYIK